METRITMDRLQKVINVVCGGISPLQVIHLEFREHVEIGRFWYLLNWRYAGNM
jgi:hypothetical protein